ncbi:MAG: Fic/DOC family N-terminal domain-containing protein [Bacteroidales bacterium]|nr:Fic/DOC family N-terminal domain-containing protein [Bacteroidales bacterium]
MRQVTKSNRRLAELKGVALTIPNENILLSSLVLQEALDSSAVENIVTTSDELYRAELDIKGGLTNAATKEVLNYREAVQVGFDMVRRNRLLTLNDIKQIQKTLEHNNAGFRTVPGTKLKSSKGEVVYIPPQSGEDVARYMSNLEQYINDPEIHDIDPLIKMAIIHHQFESIHPFYDGNGRTGRILAILYLVVNDLLDLPILYLSRYITHNKGEYYRLIQRIRDNAPDNAEDWEKWILFILKGVEETAIETIRLVKSISALMAKYKNILKPLFGKQYKHELLNNLFFHPYTKIEFMERDMSVQRKTAAKYLDTIVSETGLLQKQKLGRSNYYINTELMELFIFRAENTGSNGEFVESVKE